MFKFVRTMPKVSVIVPVYNAEKYLNRCVDSILAQTFTDWELLLVDDGSPDRSGEICDEYAAADSRIRVFHKENGGVSSARNLGLDNMQGEFVTFVDADDMLENTYLFDFQIEYSEADLYIQGYKKIKDGKIVDVKQFSGNENDYESIVASAENNNIINSPCFKLFRASVIRKNNIIFDISLSIGEDHLFSLRYLLCINQIKYTQARSYCYMLKDEESLSNRVLPIDEYLYYICECRKLHKKICESHSYSVTMYSAFDYRLLNCILRLLRDFYISGGKICQYKLMRRTIADVVGRYRFHLQNRYRLFMFFYFLAPDVVGYILFKRYLYAK